MSEDGGCPCHEVHLYEFATAYSTHSMITHVSESMTVRVA